MRVRAYKIYSFKEDHILLVINFNYIYYIILYRYAKVIISKIRFAVDILNETDNEHFLDSIIFSDEATFHVSRHGHRHLVINYAGECPQLFTENEHDSTKFNA